MNAAPTFFLALALLGLGPAACGAYDPCEDRQCGDTCTLCDPDDNDCVETAVQKVCNRNDVCTSAQPIICG